MWTSTDLIWLKESYPGLKEKSDKELEGRLSFRMLRLDNQYIVNPSLDQIQRTSVSDYLYFCDTYRIRIKWEDRNAYYSASYETGGRLEATAKRLNKRTIDMHQYPDGGLCLASPMDLYDAFLTGFQLPVYIEDFLIPYLFAQSYYAKKQVWLWVDLDHGIWGFLEWLGRRKHTSEFDLTSTFHFLKSYSKAGKINEILYTRCRNHKPCPCGSGKMTKECHPDIQSAIARLRSGLSSKIIELTRD